MESERLAKLETKMETMHSDVTEIKKDLKELLVSHISFKWRVIGFSAAIGAIIATAVELVRN